MPSDDRYISGDKRAVYWPVKRGVVISRGQQLWAAARDDVRPASSCPWQGTLEATQEYFHDRFVGVSLSDCKVSEDLPVLVATAGVFEFDFAPGMFELGVLIGPSLGPHGTHLENRKVASVSAEHLSIGSVGVRQHHGAPTVLVDVLASYIRGGQQPVA